MINIQRVIFVAMLLIYFSTAFCENSKSYLQQNKMTIYDYKGGANKDFFKIKDTSKNTSEHPATTQLPFGSISYFKPKYDEKFYTDLICKPIGSLLEKGWSKTVLKKTRFYRIPKLGKINFIPVSYPDSDRCDDGKKFGNYIKLSLYRYELPPIEGYRCFYMCDYDPLKKNYSEKVKANCEWCLPSFLYGYLILYNPKTMEANVIQIYLNSFIDGLVYTRRFFIDKNYTIYLADYTQAGDDNNIATTPALTAIHKLNFLANGKIMVKNLKR